MFTAYGRRRRHRRSRAPHHVIMLVAFALMVLSPIAANASVADQAGAATDLQAQATEEAPPDATEEVTTEELPTEEPMPTEEPVNELLGAVEIDYWECPAGFDIANADLENLFQDCEGADGVEFNVQTSDGGSQSQMTGEFGDAHVSFTELPTGMTAFGQANPTGDIAVYCNGIVQHGGPETGVQMLPVTNGAVQWDLQDDEIVFCSWLVAPAAEPADLLVHKYTCAEGYDPHAQDADPIADCTGSTNGVNFTLDSPDPAVTDLQTMTGDSVDGAVMFGGTAAGSYTLMETLPDTTESAFLWNCDTPDGPLEEDESALPLNEGDSWDLQMTGQDLECYWFNIPMAGTGTETATEPVTGTETATEPANELVGAIEIEYRECPAGYTYLDAADEDQLDQMLTDCAQVNDVEFTIDQGGPDGTSQLTGFFGDSHISFTEVPTGMRTVTQTVPFADTYVTCNGIVQHGGPETGVMDVTATNGAIQWNLLDDEIAFCNWFVMGQGEAIDATETPDGDGNSVTVYKWLCPEGTGYNLSQEDYLAECSQEHLNIPIALTDANGERATTTQANGTEWDNVVPIVGTVSNLVLVQEEIPEGFGDPVVYCAPLDFEGEWPILPSAGGGISIEDFGADTPWTVQCNWFNIPYEASTITITKWYCPDGTTYDHDDAWYQDNCTEYHEGVDFKVLHGSGGSTETTDASGMVQWTNVGEGPFSIQEYIPYEYGEPVVICGFTAIYNGAVLDGFPQRVEAPYGYYESSIEVPNTDYFCNWYNIPAGPGEITIYKYTCPEGYDLHAWNADPQEDCIEATNGIEFFLGGAATELSSETGDSIDGAVYFGDLEPGSYTVTETVPEGTDYVFVLDCYGQDRGSIRPYPLSMGDTLGIELGGGESVTCYWYNVPEYDPGYGRITVYKYECTTATYTSDIDCETYEDGQEFDLVFWDGDSWEYVATKTTDGVGKITWINVDPGQYWLDEHDAEWCHITSAQMSDDGNWFGVSENQETVIEVYNCTDTPGKPGKTPTKYPNTGVPPVNGGSGVPFELPALAPFAGLLFLRRARTSAPVVDGRPAAAPENTPMERTFSRRQVAAGLGLPLAGSFVLGRAILAQGDQAIEPLEGTPAGTPASLCLQATPGSGNGPGDGSGTGQGTGQGDQDDTTEGNGDGQGNGDGDGQGTGQGNGQGDQDDATAAGEECLRGPVPVTLQVEAIGVDAPIEILETVQGVMQQPSDEVHVAWYKETARLGEVGNLLLAGHVNWWGVPEAVFFNLGTLAENDPVVLLDEAGTAYHYAIEWVRQESNLEPPREEVLGMTDYEAVTLMTCSGEWNSELSEYDSRTVARAKRVPVPDGTPAA